MKLWVNYGDFGYATSHAYLNFQFILFYLQVTKTRPNDRDAKMKYNECQKVVKMMLFQKAIAVDDDKKSVSESINLEAMGMETYVIFQHNLAS